MTFSFRLQKPSRWPDCTSKAPDYSRAALGWWGADTLSFRGQRIRTRWLCSSGNAVLSLRLGKAQSAMPWRWGKLLLVSSGRKAGDGRRESEHTPAASRPPRLEPTGHFSSENEGVPLAVVHCPQIHVSSVRRLVPR